MLDTRISRRAAMMGAGTVAAWLASPARALLQAAGTADGPGLSSIELIARMTLEEKAGQLSLMASAWGGGAAAALNPPSDTRNFPQQVEEARQGQLTGVFNGNGARMARIMQTAAVKELRLKIPLIFAADIIHGHRTIFPVPLAEVASFEPELARRTAEAAAFEAARRGHRLDLLADGRRRARPALGPRRRRRRRGPAARQPVRGRASARLPGRRPQVERAYARLHQAFRGVRRSGIGPRLQYRRHVRARAARGLSASPTRPAFDAGALSAMASFNEINGVPATGNHWLQTELLRGEWGFQGFVVSDYTGDEEMIAAGYAKDGRDAARLAFLAGVDMSMQSGLYRKYLPDLVRKGEVPEALLESLRCAACWR